MKRLSGGIDIGSESHHITILDEEDKVLYNQKVAHKLNEFAESIKLFKQIEKPSPVTESLKLLSRHQQTLIDEKVRLTNRLRKKLLEICPEILKLAKLKEKKLIAILAQYPDFSKYKRITLKSLLKIKGIGKKQAPFLLKRLNHLEYVPGLTDIYQTIIFSYAQCILPLEEEIKDLDKKLDEIGEKNKEVNHLKTIPGVATKLASRFIGEIGDINRFPSEKQLAIYGGIACVNNDSGKVTKARVVYKANKICKQTLIAMAGCSISFSPQCKVYYLKKQAEGKNHNHILRCLARQLIKVIYKMLTEDRDYIIRKELKKAA
jgi:transposase